MLSGAAVAGQILGGILTSADIAGTGWRPIFLVNVPIGLVLLAAGTRLLPAARPDAATGRDRRNHHEHRCRRTGAAVRGVRRFPAPSVMSIAAVPRPS